MAPRWGGLRPEPYKLSPPDADSDMIVQEGTAWERPGGLRLLDRLGNAITAGMESLSPVDGLRYVDAGGKDVAYVPTWTGDDVPVPGTGLRTLKNMSGVRTVGEMTTGSSASLKDRGLALGDRRKAVADAIREAQKPKPGEGMVHRDGDPIDAKAFLQIALNSDHGDADVGGIPRLAFLAEYQGGNYDEWLIEQIEQDHGLTGLTKEHIDQLIVDMRENARRGVPEKITVYRADDGDVVGRFDRAELGPVSVTQSREEASEYGEAVEFEIPREAVEFVSPETNEFVVDPEFLKSKESEKVPEPEPHPLLRGIAKAEKVKAELEAVGGHYRMTAKERKAFTDSEAERAKGTAEKAALGRPWRADGRTGAELVKPHREEVLKRLREQLDIQDDVLAGPHDQATKDRHAKYKERLQKGIDYLESHTDEEFVADLAKALRIWHDDEDNDLSVAIPHGSAFDGFLEEGYKTTHETESEHSGDDIRGDYEVSQGVPRDAPESVRPASGFVHAGATKRHLAKEDEDFVHDPRRDHPDRDHTLTALQHQRVMHGKSVYGQIHLVLNPDVKERTKAGEGDSLNGSVRMAPMVGATDEELVDSFLAVDGGKGAQGQQWFSKIRRALELVIDGPGENQQNIGFRDQGIHETEMKLGGDLYVEALIFGSFDLDDVAEIRIPPTVWTTQALAHAPLRSMVPSYGHDDSPAEQALMGVLQTGKDIKDLDPEIEALIRKALIETPEQVRDAIGNTRFAIVMNDLASMRKRADMLAAVRAKNKEVKVTFLSELGVDMDDVSIFGAEGVGKTVEQVYQARLIEALEKLAIEIKNWKPRAPSDIPMASRI